MAKEYLIGDFLKRIKRPVNLVDDQDYKLVTIKMNHNGVVLREIKKGALIKSKMYEVKKDDFILSGIDARNGAFGIVPPELDGAIVTNDFWYFEIDESIISKRLFLELTATAWFDEICKRGSDGTTQRIRLQKDKFFNQTVLLPEVHEQESLLEKILSFKKRQSHLFSEIQTQKQLISELKQSILQEAIQGKLTAAWRKQHPGVEPASELLKRIKAQKAQLIRDKKIRKEKPLPPISEDEIPFELPEGWVWCRFQDLVSYRKGKKPSVLVKEQSQKYNIPYIDIEAFEKGVLKQYTNDPKAVISATSNILLVWDGSRMGLVGKGIFGAVGSTLVKIDLFQIDFNFLYYLLSSKFKYFNSNPKQAGLPHMNGSLLDKMLIGLPPLLEQKAIVDKIEILFEKVESLEQEIAQSEQHANMLMQAVLKEAFEGEKKIED